MKNKISYLIEAKDVHRDLTKVRERGFCEWIKSTISSLKFPLIIARIWRNLKFWFIYHAFMFRLYFFPFSYYIYFLFLYIYIFFYYFLFYSFKRRKNMVPLAIDVRNTIRLDALPHHTYRFSIFKNGRWCWLQNLTSFLLLSIIHTHRVFLIKSIIIILSLAHALSL